MSEEVIKEWNYAQTVNEDGELSDRKLSITNKRIIIIEKSENRLEHSEIKLESIVGYEVNNFFSRKPIFFILGLFFLIMLIITLILSISKGPSLISIILMFFETVFLVLFLYLFFSKYDRSLKISFLFNDSNVAIINVGVLFPHLNLKSNPNISLSAILLFPINLIKKMINSISNQNKSFHFTINQNDVNEITEILGSLIIY